MLPLLCLASYAATVASLTIRPTENEKAMITPGPKWDGLKKRYIVYYYYYVDFDEVTTCGHIPHSVAVQNSLYGTSAATAGSTPFPVTCEGYCANVGNYLDCVDRSTQMVATICWDYSATPTNTRCLADEACYWDKECSHSGVPYCNTIIYGGNVTQFTCGVQKNSPMTIDGLSNFTAYSAVKANVTRTSSSSMSSQTNSDISVSEALQKIGLSVGALTGILVGALALCCIGCFGWCWWSSRHASKQKYGQAPYTHAGASYQPVMQQSLVGQTYQGQRYEQYKHR